MKSGARYAGSSNGQCRAWLEKQECEKLRANLLWPAERVRKSMNVEDALHDYFILMRDRGRRWERRGRCD
jgi:hypothetical protein